MKRPQLGCSSSTFISMGAGSHMLLSLVSYWSLFTIQKVWWGLFCLPKLYPWPISLFDKCVKVNRSIPPSSSPIFPNPLVNHFTNFLPLWHLSHKHPKKVSLLRTEWSWVTSLICTSIPYIFPSHLPIAWTEPQTYQNDDPTTRYSYHWNSHCKLFLCPLPLEMISSELRS